MRDYRSADGERRLWFDPGEIEAIVDGELRRADLMPTVSNPVTDLESFVEQYLNCPLDQYAPLPSEVLGVTTFPRGKPPAISLNSDLTGAAIDDEDAAPGLAGRWRATLAHEASHVLLHRILFEVDDNQGQLFGQPAEPREPKPCLKRDFGHGRGGDWREIQANQGMAALLMPTRVFKRIVRRTANELDVSVAGLHDGSREATLIAGAVAQHFEVSRQAALIRMRTTGIVVDPGSPQLGQE